MTDWNNTGSVDSGEKPTGLGHLSPDIPQELLALALKMKAARDVRSRYFGREMFGEAAWDMLLALYIAQGRGYRLKVSDACVESKLPSTTALRWLDHLYETGFVNRGQNLTDRRSHLLSITPSGIARMNDYLGSTLKNLSRN